MSRPGLAHARLRLPSAETALLFPGDLVGRVWSAGVQVNDPRISEAHAYASLRDGQLRLIALRGLLFVHGLQVEEAVLREGLRVGLTRDLVLEVLAVRVPEAVAAVRVGGVQTLLLGTRAHLLEDGRISADPATGSVAELWSTGDGWFLRALGEVERRLIEEQPVRVGELELVLTSAPTEHAVVPPTVDRPTDAHLVLRARFDTVQVHRARQAPALIAGVPARILSVLAELGAPAHWEVVAGEIWRRVDDRNLLRKRWDKGLASLRRKLAEHELREDLVQTGGGMVELVLGPRDKVEVET